MIRPPLFLGLPMLAAAGLFALPSFPGAVGWGGELTGGRGGQVIHVTSLGSAGTGSLRTACMTAGAKIIVFDTGGVIDLQSSPITVSSNTTIAGQTAPGGVTLINGGLYCGSGAQNIIIRFVRVRRSADDANGDCFTLAGASGILVDHCSGTWASDEIMGVGTGNTITIQNCILASPGSCFEHYGTGSGYGNNRTILLAAPSDGRITVYRTVMAHGMKRTPFLSNRGASSGVGKTYEVINNIIYNCMRNDNESFNEENNVNVNVVGNCYKPGPSMGYAGMPWHHCGSNPPKMYAHVSRNYHTAFPTANVPQAFVSATTVLGFVDSFITPRKTPETAIITGQSAYLSVTGTAGPWPRDSTDRRLVREVLTGTGKWQDSCHPVPDPYLRGTGRPPLDTDRDGMPDTWESAHGLNPNNIADRTTDMGGYNAVEVYLNELAETAVPPDVAMEKTPFRPTGAFPWISARPNPFRSTVELSFSEFTPRGAVATLFAPDGKALAVFKPGSAVLRWNSGNLASGVYLLRVMIGEKAWSQRLVLQR